MRRLLPALAVLAAVALAACGGGGSKATAPPTLEPGAKLRVVATTNIIGDFAANIGGDKIDLTVLVQPNGDPHTLVLSKEQTDAVRQAQIVFRNGLGLDSFVDKAIDAKKQRVVDLSKNVETTTVKDDTDELDGHIWFNPLNAIAMVRELGAALADVDKENAQYYRDRTADYMAQLATMNEQMYQLAAGVPPSCRHVISNHNSLRYLDATFGYKQEDSVIPSNSTKGGATGADIERAAASVRKFHVPIVFAEYSSDPKYIEEVARQTGVRVVTIYTDSLGPPGSDGATYIDMMLFDGRKIADAIRTCQG